MNIKTWNMNMVRMVEQGTQRMGSYWYPGGTAVPLDFLSLGFLLYAKKHTPFLSKRASPVICCWRRFSLRSELNGILSSTECQVLSILCSIYFCTLDLPLSPWGKNTRDKAVSLCLWNKCWAIVCPQEILVLDSARSKNLMFS